ncbi:MAG: sterol desaturase family protein [Hyphomonadaceae bacterium]|nr:sterol desaturase family protein [Hyphomonadaceae bacterium]
MNNPQFPDILIWAIPVFLLGIAIELFWLRRRPIENAYTFKDAITSLVMGSGMSLTDLLFKGINLAFLMWIWLTFPHFDLGYTLPIILLALFVDDFFYYWKHWLYHKSRWFWATHVVHHSSEHYNLTTALRQPWSNYISGTVLLKIPMVFLGFHPVLLAFVGGLNLLYQFWIHTETINKMPRWFEYIFNTPSHHRVHHGRNPRYLDANFGGIFIIWDRLFGTFVPEQENEKPDYGIVVPLKTYNPIKVAFHEYVAMIKDAFQPGLNLKQRFLYVFAPPGTCHDGSKQPIAEIKADFIARHPDQAGTPGLPIK